MSHSIFSDHLEKSVIAGLNDYSLIRVSGDDAFTFLQTQLTNDLNSLQNGHSQLQSYCNIKGRAHCVMRIMQADDNSLYMILPKELSAKVLAILRMYVLRAKVIFEEVANEKIYLIANQVNLDFISEVKQYEVHPKHSLHFIIADKETSQKIEQSTYYCDRFDYYRLHDIYNVIGQVYQHSYDQFIPQFLNLDLTKVLNFNKGCYPGQEIIARLRYLGKIKQRMIIAQSNSRCEIGDKVYLKSQPDKMVGTVSNVIKTELDAHTLTNIVLNSDYLDISNSLILSDQTDVERIQMPYDTPIDYQSTKS